MGLVAGAGRVGDPPVVLVGHELEPRDRLGPAGEARRACRGSTRRARAAHVGPPPTRRRTSRTRTSFDLPGQRGRRGIGRQAGPDLSGRYGVVGSARRTSPAVPAREPGRPARAGDRFASASVGRAPAVRRARSTGRAPTAIPSSRPTNSATRNGRTTAAGQRARARAATAPRSALRAAHRVPGSPGAREHPNRRRQKPLPQLHAGVNRRDPAARSGCSTAKATVAASPTLNAVPSA